MKMAGIVVAVLFVGLTAGSAEVPGPKEAPVDRPDLIGMFEEDQADRVNPTVDWKIVLPRDQARLAKVKELFAAGSLHSNGDFYRAAMILQHGSVPEDFLLAHEFCVAAMALGRNDQATRWLAAASEDRFLMNLDRPQRFGTQYRSDGSGPMLLYKVGEGVTDELRRIMATPSLSEAKAREADANKR